MQTHRLQGAINVCRASTATSEVPRYQQCVELDIIVQLMTRVVLAPRSLAAQAITALPALAARLNVLELTTAREDLTCTSSVSSEHTVRQAVPLQSHARQATTVPVTSTTTILKADAKPAAVASTHLLKKKKSALIAHLATSVLVPRAQKHRLPLKKTMAIHARLATTAHLAHTKKNPVHQQRMLSTKEQSR